MPTRQMAQMEKDAVCHISSKDEIGALADYINYLYQSLLSAIHNLDLSISMKKRKKYVAFFRPFNYGNLYVVRTFD